MPGHYYNTNGKSKPMNKKPPANSNSEKNKMNVKSKRTMTNKKKKSNPPSKIKQNIINRSGIHSVQKRRMMEHAAHHTKNHLNFMIGKLENGARFSEAHNMAMNRVGR